MKNWLFIILAGIVLGNAAVIFDIWLEGIPDIIIIPDEAVSVILIFSGFIMRKKNKK